jgi:hypothetical protein
MVSPEVVGCVCAALNPLLPSREILTPPQISGLFHGSSASEIIDTRPGIVRLYLDLAVPRAAVGPGLRPAVQVASEEADV